MDTDQEVNIAVLIPCYNEEATIGKVIDDFRSQLPKAAIFVFDNCSSDSTASIAKEHGASVIREPRQGKGFVVELMFHCLDAEIYVMVDGDDTYPAQEVHKLIEPVVRGEADMAVGARLCSYTKKSFRSLHVYGNKLVRSLVNWVGDANLTDIMSGYRVFNRRVVQNIPVVSAGFEVETEITIQMLYYRMKIIEIQVPYKARPVGSESKLRTFRDGLRVLWKIFSLFRSFKPLTFFGSIGLLFLAVGSFTGVRSLYDCMRAPDVHTGQIATVILGVGLIIMSIGCLLLGILLHSVNWRFRELHNVLTRKQKIFR